MKNTVEQIIFKCIEFLNEEIGDDNKLLLSENTLLLAEGSGIDSLQLVSLVIELEESLSAKYGVQVSLSDDEALFQENSPYHSVGSLRDYACIVISCKTK